MNSVLYDTDFDAWLAQQVAALRAHAWADVDAEHLAEEIEDVRKSERRAVTSQLVLILSHLLKWHHQPERHSTSWHDTIANGRVLIQGALEDNATLRRDLPALMSAAYSKARRLAIKDTKLNDRIFASTCPWTPEQVLDEDFWP